MHIDQALLDHAVNTQAGRPVLRLYRWRRPALSIGVHQRLTDELIARCADRDVELVRRPTGGTAVVHGDDLTYCVVAPSGNRGVLQAYSWVAEGLIAGLALLGIRAEVGSRNPAGRSSSPGASLAGSSACFAATVGADLQVGGSKICGSAQVRRAGWFLQHGSIPLRDGRPLTRELLRHPGPNNSTWLEHLHPGISEDEVAGSLVAGFESRWGTAGEVSLEMFLPSKAPAGHQSKLILA
ncbi:MAG TPA: hypothetical protein VHI31_04000 [Actinomycetota bacterium]|nr:hypothetical protein [Actinomycetota bacterium]